MRGIFLYNFLSWRISFVILPIFNRYSYFSGSINEEMVKNGQVAFKTFIENRDENTLPGKVHFAPLLYKKSIYLFTLSIDNPTEMYLYSRYYIANFLSTILYRLYYYIVSVGIRFRWILVPPLYIVWNINIWSTSSSVLLRVDPHVKKFLKP